MAVMGRLVASYSTGKDQYINDTNLLRHGYCSYILNITNPGKDLDVVYDYIFTIRFIMYFYLISTTKNYVFATL